MRTFASLLATLTLALVVAAKPVHDIRDSVLSLPIRKLVGTETSASSFRQSARGRVQQLRERAGIAEVKDSLVERKLDLEATNNAFFYSIDVKIGEPPLVYGLVVDSASGNTWVGSGRAWKSSETTVETNSTLFLTLPRVYPEGGPVDVEGYEVLDKLALTPTLAIERQSIGVATNISTDWLYRGDGSFGIGPAGLTLGTLSPDTEAVPTVVDNLVAQGTIAQNVVGVSFNVSQTAASYIDGELSFGGIDSSKYVDDITYVPITSTSPSSKFWGVDASVRYGNGTELLKTGAGIIDSASMLNYLSSDAFAKYVEALGAVYDDYSALYTVNSTKYDKLESLYFEVGGKTFELTPNAQIFPRSQAGGIFDDETLLYLVMGDLGTPSGQGMDFVLGMPALERLYTVLDSDNKRVGLANTPYTFAEAP